MIDNIEIKKINKDLIFKLLFYNSILVIIGYATARGVGMGIFQAIKIFKTIFLFASLFYVIRINGFSIVNIYNRSVILFLVAVIFVFSFLGNDPFASLYKGLTFILPFLYVLLTMNHLLRYGAFNLLIAFSRIVLLTYSIVPIYYFLFATGTGNANIYGYQEGEFFVSNHYGWASTIFILCALTILRFYPLKKSMKLLIYTAIPFVFYLLIISANRSGILSIAIAMFFFITRDKFAHISLKIIVIVGAFLILSLIAVQENSAIDFLQEKNEMQLESGEEGRLIITQAMLRSFNVNPTFWFTGVGMFDYTQLFIYSGMKSAYHNSYWEVLFGTGVLVFSFFLYFMVIYPIKIFWRITTSYSLLVIPLMIIPLFEGNLTAGQFLFFPWFAYMILLNSKEFNYYSKVKINH